MQESNQRRSGHSSCSSITAPHKRPTARQLLSLPIDYPRFFSDFLNLIITSLKEPKLFKPSSLNVKLRLMKILLGNVESGVIYFVEV